MHTSAVRRAEYNHNYIGLGKSIPLHILFSENLNAEAYGRSPRKTLYSSYHMKSVISVSDILYFPYDIIVMIQNCFFNRCLKSDKSKLNCQINLKLKSKLKISLYCFKQSLTKVQTLTYFKQWSGDGTKAKRHQVWLQPPMVLFHIIQ